MAGRVSFDGAWLSLLHGCHGVVGEPAAHLTRNVKTPFKICQGGNKYQEGYYYLKVYLIECVPSCGCRTKIILSLGQVLNMMCLHALSVCRRTPQFLEMASAGAPAFGHDEQQTVRKILPPS